MKAGPGRPKGLPNKATANVRAALALLAERNASKLEEWISRVAKKDPAKAADLMIRIFEYHIPKLARTELTGASGGPLELTIADPTRAKPTQE